MPAHGNYGNGTGSVVFTVHEAGDRIVYGQPGSAHHGHLHYELERVTLVIKSMDATPQRQGLGSLLLWFAASTALFNRKQTITATNTARTAIGFYRRMGFLPDPAEHGRAQAVYATLTPQERLGQPSADVFVATWCAPSQNVLNSAWAEISTPPNVWRHVW